MNKCLKTATINEEKIWIKRGLSQLWQIPKLGKTLLWRKWLFKSFKSVIFIDFIDFTINSQPKLFKYLFKKLYHSGFKNQHYDIQIYVCLGCGNLNYTNVHSNSFKKEVYTNVHSNNFKKEVYTNVNWKSFKNEIDLY